MSESDTPAAPPSSAAPSRFLPMLLAVAVFMQMLDATILNTALPQMAADLHQPPLQMQSAVVSYALTLALLMPLSGYLCDRFGTRQVFFVSLLVFVAGSVLCAAAPNLNTLVFARVVQGAGGAMLAPAPRIIIMKSYEKTELIGMMNYVVMPALLGPVIGPLLGGYLVEYAGWHWIFLINVPFGLAAAWFTLKIMPDYKETEHPPHFDIAGFLLFGGGAVGLSMAVEIAQFPGAGLFAVLAALMSLAAIGLYWRHARHDSEPLYSRELLRVRTYRIGLSGNLASRLGMGAVPFLLPLLLQVAFGHSASVSGRMLAPVALATLAAKPAIRPLMARFGYRRVLTVNTALIGLLIMALSLPSADTPLWQLMPLLLLIGAVNSIQFTGMNSLTLADLHPQQAGSGASLMTVNQQLATGFGIAIGAALLQYFGKLPPIGGNVSAAFRLTFLSIGLLTLLSALIFARLHRSDGENLIRAARTGGQ